MIYRFFVAIASVLICSVSFAADTTKSSQLTLSALARDLVKARALPEGTRPQPPDDVELSDLLGLSFSSVRHALGVPDKRHRRWVPPGCHAPICLTYTYGRQESPATSSAPVDLGNGMMEILVSTGGPYLLVLGFSGDRLVSADWLGQR
jgi:hypothetical protein